jgi:Rod binding domain-containing protein
MNIPVDLRPSGLDVEAVQERIKNSGQAIHGIKNHNEKSEIKKVAKEMEALFVYELIKEMRKISETMSPDEKGMGNETYMGLFDMEVSRVIADRGFGLKDKIENWLENKIQLNDNLNNNLDKK